MHSGKRRDETEEMMTLSQQIPCEVPIDPKNSPFCNPLYANPVKKNNRKQRDSPDSNNSRKHFMIKNDENINGTQLEDSKDEIRVLSSLHANNQVLSKTRSLSPETAMPGDLPQDENVDTLRGDWKDKKPEVRAIDPENVDNDGSKGKNRGKRKQRLFKLKFHHQALPPEYLDHYEASLRQQPPMGLSRSNDIRETVNGPREVIQNDLQSCLRQRPRNKESRLARSSRPVTIHEAGNATEALIRDFLLSSPHLQKAALQQAAIARAQSVPSVMIAETNKARHTPVHPPPSPCESMSTVDRMSCTSDMSVEEAVPRRGRKSKKNKKLNSSQSMSSQSIVGTDCGVPSGNSLNFQSNSLASQCTNLERYALARSRSYSSIMNDSQNEPLNLCVRDESKERVCSPYQESCDPAQGKIKFEPESLENERSPVFKKESVGFNPEQHNQPYAPEHPPWPYGDYFLTGNPNWLHDYRLKPEDGLSSGHSTPSISSNSSHLPCFSPPIWPHFSPPPYSPSPVPPLSPLAPQHSRHIQNLIKDSLSQKFDDSIRERLTPTDSYLKSSNRPGGMNSNFRLSTIKGGARRRRSTLFIPPPDPNNEVSICKFKFIGGANPMLEEKKMVSVDSKGTLRYFNGGEKNVIKDNKDSNRLTGKVLESLTKCEKDVKKIRLESDNDDTCSLSGFEAENIYSNRITSPLQPAAEADPHLNSSSPIEDSPKRKRRSKKSSVREKLEQTLKEKGLLIQTQQVESAEGATYCKFRQLRKITRYLFRSWKEYLPGQEGAPMADLQNVASLYNNSMPLQVNKTT